jgi:hypothetical protein
MGPRRAGEDATHLASASVSAKPASTFVTGGSEAGNYSKCLPCGQS